MLNPNPGLQHFTYQVFTRKSIRFQASQFVFKQVNSLFHADDSSMNGTDNSLLFKAESFETLFTALPFSATDWRVSSVPIIFSFDNRGPGLNGGIKTSVSVAFWGRWLPGTRAVVVLLLPRDVMLEWLAVIIDRDKRCFCSPRFTTLRATLTNRM